MSTSERSPYREISLRCRDDVIGLVRLTHEGHGKSRGLFAPGPDFERYRALFERMFALERRIESHSADYLGAWHDWSQSLKAIQNLGLTFGEPGIPIEDFECMSDWTVSFQTALWWLATHE